MVVVQGEFAPQAADVERNDRDLGTEIALDISENKIYVIDQNLALVIFSNTENLFSYIHENAFTNHHPAANLKVMVRAAGEVASNRVRGRKHSAKLCHARSKKQMHSTPIFTSKIGLWPKF